MSSNLVPHYAPEGITGHMLQSQFLIWSTERGQVAPGFAVLQKAVSPPKLEAAHISSLQTPPSFSAQPFIIELQVEVAPDTE